MKEVTDLKPYITENLNMKDIFAGAWLLTGDEKKELIVKFGGAMSKSERIIVLQLIGKNLMEQAAQDDEENDGHSGFGDLMDGIRLREWHKEDDEAIASAKPHEIIEQEEKEHE